MREFYSDVMRQLDEKIEAFIQIVEKTNKKIVVWGTNHYGQLVQQLLADRIDLGVVAYFGDNDCQKWGKSINGVVVKNIEFFAQNPQQYFVIICSFWENEIANQLDQFAIEYTRESWPVTYKEFLKKHYVTYDKNKKYNLDIENVWNVFNKARMLYDQKNVKEKLSKVKELLVDDYSKIIYDKRIDFLTHGDLTLISDYFTKTLEYFPRCYYNEKHFSDQEVFVDCGAYIGDTIEEFIRAVDGKYKKIYAYEPDEKCYAVADSYIKSNDLNVRLVQKGVGECASDGEIVVTSLDEDIEDAITWIKMDIEGYELSALKGARKLIQEYHPKLAICLYHKVQDIYEIPLYLHEIVPEYRFKLSQHFRGHYDFILYADTYEN